MTNDGEACIVVDHINQIECDESSQVIWKADSSLTFKLFLCKIYLGRRRCFGGNYLLISVMEERKIRKLNIFKSSIFSVNLFFSFDPWNVVESGIYSN